MKSYILLIVSFSLVVGIFSNAMAVNFNMNPGTVVASTYYTFTPGSYNGPTGEGSLFATGTVTDAVDMLAANMSNADADGWNMDQAEIIGNLDAFTWFGVPGGAHHTTSAVQLDKTNMNLGTILVNMAPWNWFWNGTDVALGNGLDGISGNADDWAIVSWGTDNAWGGGDDTFWYQALTGLPPTLMGPYYEVYLEGNVVPEPASLLLLGSGLAGLVGLKRKWRR